MLSPGRAKHRPGKDVPSIGSLNGLDKRADFLSFVGPIHGKEQPITPGDASLGPGLSYLYPFQGFLWRGRSVPSCNAFEMPLRFREARIWG